MNGQMQKQQQMNTESVNNSPIEEKLDSAFVTCCGSTCLGVTCCVLPPCGFCLWPCFQRSRMAQAGIFIGVSVASLICMIILFVSGAQLSRHSYRFCTDVSPWYALYLSALPYSLINFHELYEHYEHHEHHWDYDDINLYECSDNARNLSIACFIIGAFYLILSGGLGYLGFKRFQQARGSTSKS